MTLSGVHWPSVLAGVTAAILFICGALLLTLAIEMKARRQLDAMLDWVERTAARVREWIESKLSGN